MSNYETVNRVCFECSGKNKPSCSCQANVSRLDRIEGDGFHSKGKISPESCPVSCQCIEEEAWNKNIPPKPNCEWLNSFKELRRQWSNHSRQQQNCKCYGCNSYRCQSCLLSSYTGANVSSPTVRRQNDCYKDRPLASRSKDKSTSTSGCSLLNSNSQVASFQNSRSPRRPILRKGQCIPECCFCHNGGKICNCASSVRENSSERENSTFFSDYSRERKFPRNNSESTDEKLYYRKFQLKDGKYESSTLPLCGQCTLRRSKVKCTKTNCCHEDSDSSSSRSKSATPLKSHHQKTSDNFYEENNVPQSQLGGHDSSGTLTDVVKDESCCCCNLKISENRREFIKQQCHNSKQNSHLPKNCFQCPICSSVLSSIAWKNNLKFKIPNENSNFNSSISSGIETHKIADEVSKQEKCNNNENVKFHQQYESDQKKTFRNSTLLNEENSIALDSSKDQYNRKEKILSCLNDCKRYNKKKKKQFSCKFKLDQKSKSFNNHLISSQQVTQQKLDDENTSTGNKKINVQTISNDDVNLNQSSSDDYVIHSR